VGADNSAAVVGVLSHPDTGELSQRQVRYEDLPDRKDIPRARTPEIGHSHSKAADEEALVIVAGHITVEPQQLRVATDDRHGGAP
jgi:hypothetical protein